MKSDPLYFLAGFAGLAFGWDVAFAMALVFVIFQFGISLVLHFKVKKLYKEHEELHAAQLAEQGAPLAGPPASPAAPAPGVEPGAYL